MEHYREDRYKVHEERDCKKCEENRDWLFKHSPTVRFLQEKIYALNGDIDSTNVICRRCPGRVLNENGEVYRQSGGFSPNHGILICANEIRDRGHLEDTLSHEMVHAWDHLRWKVDWAGRKDLRHSACTEVSLFLFYCVLAGRNFQLETPRSSGQIRLTKLPYNLDPSINAKRRVSVVARDLYKGELEPHAAVPELRTDAGRPVRHGETDVQGRQARCEGGQRGVGLLFQRQEAF